MPRQPRTVSETGYYHVVTRGIGHQLLFEDRTDCLYYISLLERHSINTGVRICAYCLMQNHVHLLLFDRGNSIPEFMKRLGVSYSYYFNRKYERSGHLFQDRYKSDAINDDSYLLSALKYILNNPKAAGGSEAKNYEWSSYRLFGNEQSFVDTDIFVGMLGNFENYERFISETDGTAAMPEHTRLHSEEINGILLKELGTVNGTVVQQFDMKKRNEAIIKLREAGMSIRQIERYTGVSRGIIRNLFW